MMFEHQHPQFARSGKSHWSDLEFAITRFVGDLSPLPHLFCIFFEGFETLLGFFLQALQAGSFQPGQSA